MFPDTDRVIYEHAPLVDVTCQLRFPTILRIEGELPAAFQERVRHHFPNFTQEQEGVVPDLPPELAKAIGALPGPAERTKYRFSSEDESWSLTLTRDFLALSTTSYTRWEDFRDRLQGPINALVEEYRPTAFSRVGLRYIDLIRKSTIGLENADWQDLLQVHILGELAVAFVRESAQQVAKQVRFTIDSNFGVLLQHGFAEEKDSREQAYVIDYDFYTAKKTETGNAIGILNNFNGYARRAFRWCITDTLHGALGPTPVELHRQSA